MSAVTLTYKDPDLGVLELECECDYPAGRAAGLRWDLVSVTQTATEKDLDLDEFLSKVEQSSGGYDALGDLVTTAYERYLDDRHADHD